jgi:hypothetical protein
MGRCKIVMASAVDFSTKNSSKVWSPVVVKNFIKI